MKKSFCFVFCLATMVLLFAGCASDGSEFRQKSYTAEEGIHSLQIDVRDRIVKIEPSSDKQISVIYFESEEESYQFSVVDETILAMTSQSNKEWNDFIGGKAPAEQRTVIVKIPENKLSSLQISTTNENVELPALSITDSASIYVNGGDILFDTMEIGNSLTLESKNGNITGTVAGGYDDFSISSSVKKGENNLPEQKEGGEKTMTVTANNGDIAIRFTK